MSNWLMTESQRAAAVELVEQAMMSGFMQITSNKALIQEAYTGATDQSGGDLLRAALNGYAAEWVDIRVGLFDGLFTAWDANEDRA